MKNKIIDIISNAEGVDKDTIKEIKEYLDKFDDSVERILEGKDEAMERFTNKLKEKEWWVDVKKSKWTKRSID